MKQQQQKNSNHILLEVQYQVQHCSATTSIYSWPSPQMSHHILIWSVSKVYRFIWLVSCGEMLCMQGIKKM